MAGFTLNTLIPIGGQSTRGLGPQLWTYTSADTLATQDSAGYFNNASDRLARGDIILSVVTSTGAPVAFGILIVNANSSGVVDTIDVINSDTTLSDND